VKLRTSLIISLEISSVRNFGRKLHVNDVKGLRKDQVTPLFEGKEDLALAGRVSERDDRFSLTHQIRQIEESGGNEKELQLKEAYRYLLTNTTGRQDPWIDDHVGNLTIGRF